MILDKISEINTSNINQLYPFIFEHYELEAFEGEDCISFAGKHRKFRVDENSNNNQISFDSCSLLTMYLNIGQFIHESILKDKYSIIFDNDYITITSNHLYSRLVNMVLDFCSKYGNYEELQTVSGNPTPYLQGDRWKPMPLWKLISQASRLYLLYGHFDNNNQYVNTFSNQIRLDDLSVSLKMSPEITFGANGNRKMKIVFDCYELYEIAKYQFIYSLIDDGKKIYRCLYCGQFGASDRKKVFCSKSHANMYSKNQTRTYDRTRICKCGKEFKPTTQKQKYCNAKCRRKYGIKKADGLSEAVKEEGE